MRIRSYRHRATARPGDGPAASLPRVTVAERRVGRQATGIPASAGWPAAQLIMLWLELRRDARRHARRRSSAASTTATPSSARPAMRSPGTTAACSKPDRRQHTGGAGAAGPPPGAGHAGGRRRAAAGWPRRDCGHPTGLVKRDPESKRRVVQDHSRTGRYRTGWSEALVPAPPSQRRC